jgi:uncharacterized protein (TIRG00374 family)
LKKFTAVLRFLFFLGIGIFLLWLAIRGLNPQKIIDGFAHANYFYIILALLVSLVSHFLRAVRWNLLIRPLGYKVHARNSFIAVLIGYMVNFAIPRMGEISRCVILNRSDRIPLNKLIGTVVIERIFDTITLLIIIVFTFFIEFERLKELVYNYLYNPIVSKYQQLGLLLLIAIVAIIGFLGLVAWLMIRFIRNKSATSKFIDKVHNLLSGFYTGIKTIRTMEHKWLFVMYTILIWAGYWMMTYIIFDALQETRGLGLAAGLAVLAIGSIGIVFPSPGGIGSYHYAAIIALSFYKPLEVAAESWSESSAIYSLISHESQMIFLILAGGIAYMFFVFHQRRHKSKDIGIFTTHIDEEELVEDKTV